MNLNIQHAVAAGWLKLPEPAEVKPRKRAHTKFKANFSVEVEIEIRGEAVDEALKLAVDKTNEVLRCHVSTWPAHIDAAYETKSVGCRLHSITQTTEQANHETV